MSFVRPLWNRLRKNSRVTSLATTVVEKIAVTSTPARVNSKPPSKGWKFLKRSTTARSPQRIPAIHEPGVDFDAFPRRNAMSIKRGRPNRPPRPTRRYVRCPSITPTTEPAANDQRKEPAPSRLFSMKALCNDFDKKVSLSTSTEETSSSGDRESHEPLRVYSVGLASPVTDADRETLAPAKKVSTNKQSRAYKRALGRIWTSKDDTCSLPVEPWGPIKRWECCKCDVSPKANDGHDEVKEGSVAAGLAKQLLLSLQKKSGVVGAKTMVEQEVCSNLACVHRRCKKCRFVVESVPSLPKLHRKKKRSRRSSKA